LQEEGLGVEEASRNEEITQLWLREPFKYGAEPYNFMITDQLAQSIRKQARALSIQLSGGRL
jgi:hypothetical protein